MADRLTYQYKGKNYSLPATLSQDEALNTIKGSLGEEVAAPEIAAPGKEYESNWYDRPRAVLQGAALGLSDEIGAGVAAGMQKLTGADEGFVDIYNDIHQSLQDERESYEEANPVESLALNVGGGLLTGGYGASRAAAGQGGKRGLDAALKAMQGRKAGGDVIQASRAAQAADKLAKAQALKRAAGVAGVEGAIAGGASADQGERIGGAARGLATGLALPGAVAAVRGTGNQLAKRRIAQELGKGDDFIPAPLADEGISGEFFRNTVARAFGGKPLHQQTGRVLGRAREALERSAERAEGARDTAATGLSAAKRAAITAKDKAVAGIKDTFEESGWKRAIPDDMPQEELAKLEKLRPKQRDKALRNWFSKREGAFKPYKDINYQIDDEGMDALAREIQGATADPALAGRAGEQNIRGILESLYEEYDDDVGGFIAGDDLIQLRSDFGMKINSLAGREGAAQLDAAANRRVKNILDDFITKQLDEVGLGDAYRKTLDKYGAAQTLKRSVKSAKKNRGSFTPEQWLASLKGDSEYLYDEANDAIEAIAREGKRGKAAAKRIAARGGKNDPRLRDANDLVKRNQTLVAAVEERMPEANPSLFAKLFSTALLAAPGVASTSLTSPTGIASGVAVARGLASESAQRAAAGQTGWQKGLNEMLEGYDDSTRKKIFAAVERALTREVAASAGD